MNSSVWVDIIRDLPSQALEAQELPGLQATAQPFVLSSPVRVSQTGAADAPADAPRTSAAPPSTGNPRAPKKYPLSIFLIKVWLAAINVAAEHRLHAFGCWNRRTLCKCPAQAWIPKR